MSSIKTGKRDMDTKPRWMEKHPCTRCSTGYGECVQGIVISVMCCTGCNHPGRWQPDAYTVEDYEEMRKK